MSTTDATGGQRATVGLTDVGRAALSRIMEHKWFSSGDSAFRSAVAFAIANDIHPAEAGHFETVWNVGTIDKGGDFRATVEMAVGRPVQWDEIQRLGDAGLRELAKRAEFTEYPAQALLG